jgi:hypothetical protein
MAPVNIWARGIRIRDNFFIQNQPNRRLLHIVQEQSTSTVHTVPYLMSWRKLASCVLGVKILTQIFLVSGEGKPGDGLQQLHVLHVERHASRLHYDSHMESLISTVPVPGTYVHN